MKVDCIEWTGYRKRDGYGVKRFQGKNRGAHRVAYCLHYGVDIEAISGLEVRHKCDNRACINPAHLELGTHSDNMVDMVARGRNPRGERHGSATLSRNDVEFIRATYTPYSKEFGAVAMARRFGVSTSSIQRIVRRKGWL